MLSDEEKQAIEGLKGSQKWIRQQIRLGNLPDYNQGHYADIQIVLNIIEKQSKEIESLKEDNKKKSIVIIEYQDLYEKLKDKTKAKIEELENQKRQWIEDRDNKHKDSEIIYAIEVLQSLLEKE